LLAAVCAALPIASADTLVAVPKTTDKQTQQKLLNKYMKERLKNADADVRRQKSQIADLTRRISDERNLVEKVHKLELQISKLKKSQPSDENAKQQAVLKKRLAAAELATQLYKAKLAKLQAQIDKENDLEQQLKAALTAAADLEKRLSSSDVNEKIDIQNKINAAVASIADAKSEITKIRAEIDQLKEQIAQADQNSQPQSVAIAYRFASVRPVYIECAGSGITIYRQFDGAVKRTTINSYAIENSPELLSVLGEVAADNKNNGNTVVNVLVRPSGVKTYDDLRSVIKNSGVAWSSQPISANGTLEFDSLTKQTKN
jgi:hypothetical protein